MVVPFGISVGDFIAVGKLVHDIIDALNKSKGAAADYRSFISTLKSLSNSLNTIKDFLGQVTQEASHYQVHEAALLNGIGHEIDCCKTLLKSFLKDTYDYTASLLPSDAAERFGVADDFASHSSRKKVAVRRLAVMWKEVSWAVFRKEDVQRLERDLQGHMRALQTYSTFVPLLSLSRVEKDTATTALVTSETQVTIAEMFDFLKSASNKLPLQMHDKIYKKQPSFQQHLNILFKGLPGHDKVTRREYELEDNAGITAISANNWHLKVTAGAQIAMSMLFGFTAREETSSLQACPKCGAINSEPNSRGMTECFNCKLLFVVIDTKRTVESQDTTHTASAPNNTELQGGNESWKQDPFRRIRYLRETLVYPENNQSRAPEMNQLPRRIRWGAPDFSLADLLVKWSGAELKSETSIKIPRLDVSRFETRIQEIVQAFYRQSQGNGKGRAEDHLGWREPYGL
ncbi:hypothetical protein FQN54_007073 [Arachnomyces sp. PD_36]|nr:hypothetical protein FQN54_007073 [Arachnomyces sp. PD_36]